ncbi:TPA: hypothetical protein DCL30_04175 [Candidatus Peribacteria bacterium]|nr:MAG: hypothetical protein A3J91_04520 [Candidatus Peribacteria bacterium RIFOXYC2_FULL_58_10]OGJ83977.1 MAG: hypothetical protein A2529_04230 [Candidatus Peribacteria bacterium RIFOXYD2_FULL_58_15]HAI98702.1 hypothetical protein [Candidatus Peribacteria bacterium]HAS34415.1 hypothetical protein [Candidatus Peribacteria bacterium]
MEHYFVYMLRCADKSYYVGITSDLEKRINQHQEGWDPSAYTHARRPVHLVYSAAFHEVMDAIAWEKRIKRWTRKKKESLIKGAYEDLSALSRNAMQRRIRLIHQTTRSHLQKSVSW